METVGGKYQVIKKLGSGGMGEVFLVQHADLEIQYALKVLCPLLASQERFIEQFKREASVLQKFPHPGITQLRDFGRTEDDRYYLCMDYCEGRSLKEVIDEDGPYSISAALDVMIQLLDVLVNAHEHGIVHRDIKPANLMIIEEGAGSRRVKVLDFGTALLYEGFDPSSGEFAALGTPAYMSPEQASGAQTLDHRVDVYTCGVVLYELLTGSVPFESDDVVQVLLMHVTQQAPPFAKKYNMPDYLEALVHTALCKKRNDRFQSAAEFKRQCEKVLKQFLREQEGAVVELGETAIIADPEPAAVAVQSSSDAEGKTKILCLDDDEMILNIVKHLLEIEGYEVFTALDCSAIHDILFHQKVDLLLSDVQMPGMPGTKVCRLIKESISDLKVVLFSNLPERDLERFSEQNGADGWISKNTRPEEWLSIISEVIAQPQ